MSWLEDALLPGERVVWAGAPTVELAVADYLRGIRRRVTSAVIGASVLALLLQLLFIPIVVAAAVPDSNRLRLWGYLLLVLDGLLVVNGYAQAATRHGRDARRRLRALSYALTTTRVLVRYRGDVFAWSLAGLDAPLAIPAGAGTGHITFGNAAIPGPARARTVRVRDSPSQPGAGDSSHPETRWSMPATLLDAGTSWLSDRHRPVLLWVAEPGRVGDLIRRAPNTTTPGPT